MTQLIPRKPRNVQLIGLYSLLLIVILCSYAGIRTQPAVSSEKVSCGAENNNTKALGHVSQMLLSLKSFILLDSEDLNNK